MTGLFYFGKRDTVYVVVSITVILCFCISLILDGALFSCSDHDFDIVYKYNHVVECNYDLYI